MSKRPRTLMLRWNGESFCPVPSYMAYITREYVIGEVYHLAPIEERSQASHSQFFAAVAEGFQNLSEENASRFPTSEHLRKWALCQTGYCKEINYACKNESEASKLALSLRNIDEYSIIRILGDVVQRFEPESQSMRSMKKERFEASKRDVLDLIASMARTTASQLNKEAKRHGR